MIGARISTRRIDTLRLVRNLSALTTVAALTLVSAPIIPSAVRLYVLVAVLLVWAVGTGIAIIRLGLRALQCPADMVAVISTAVAIVGVALAAIMASEYWLVRTLQGRPALSWSIDWRFHWTHAQAIARTGGIAESLDYAGAPIPYHIGLPWFGGAVEGVLGTGLHATLFAIGPILCVVAVAVGLTYLARTTVGLPWRHAAAAAAITLSLPAVNGFLRPLRLLERGALSLLWPDIWWGHSIMLNALPALAAGFGGLALLLDRDAPLRWRLAGAAGVAVMIGLKPQYFVGVGALAGVFGVARFIGAPGFGPQGRRTLWIALVALGLAATVLIVFPGFPSVFEAPAVRPGDTFYSLETTVRDLGGVYNVVLVLGVATYLLLRPSTRVQGGGEVAPLSLGVGAVVGLLVVQAGLLTVELPMRPEIVERTLAVGIPDAEWIQQNNMIQTLIPLRMTIALGGVALLVRTVSLHRETRWARALSLAGILAVVGPMPFMLYVSVNPGEAWVVAEDRELYSVLEAVPLGEELVIASDLADPAENYYRPLNALLLPAYHGHRFHIANLRYLNWAYEDAPERLANTRAFFATPWSSWHEAWLARTGITHVLVHDRCPPAWESAPVLNKLAEQGPWTAYSVGEVAERTGVEGPAVPSGLEPRYGRAACLAMLSDSESRQWRKR